MLTITQALRKEGPVRTYPPRPLVNQATSGQCDSGHCRGGSNCGPGTGR